MFDFKFDRFISTSVIKFIYVFFLVILLLGWVLMIIFTLVSGPIEQILIVLIAFPIGILLFLFVLRVTCEKAIVTFKIYDKLNIITNLKTGKPINAGFDNLSKNQFVCKKCGTVVELEDTEIKIGSFNCPSCNELNLIK